MNVMRSAPVLAAGIALVAACASCAVSTTTIESQRALDPAALNRIAIGSTSVDEIYAWFGPPHSIVRGSGRFQEVAGHGYYSFVQDRQLSSLDDAHYALLYKYERARIRTTAPLRLGLEQHDRMTFEGAELLVILDSTRDVVTDYALRRERPGGAP